MPIKRPSGPPEAVDLKNLVGQAAERGVLDVRAQAVGLPGQQGIDFRVASHRLGQQQVGAGAQAAKAGGGI